MSVFHNNALIGAGGGAAAAAADFQIDRSLRFNSDDSSYLNRTPSSAGNQQTFTFSCWAKISKLNAEKNILVGQSNWFRFENTNEIYYWHNPSTNVRTDAKFRDPSAWYHVVLAVDTTQATASNRVKIYVNGVQQTLSGTQPDQNADLGFNGNYVHYLGSQGTSGSNAFNGYLAEIHNVDGSQLAASDFGEYDDNNVWQPKEYSGTYGTNGFRLTFADGSSNAALGNDSSGNSNTFTVNNLVANVEGAETSAITSISGNTLTFTDSTDLNKFNAGDIIQEVSDAPRSGYTSQVPTNPENAVDGDINTHTIFSSNSGSSSDWYEWTLPYARSYTTLQVVMSGSAASGNDVYIGASNGTATQATNQFESSLTSTATAYTLTGMPNPVKSFSLFLSGGNYSPTFKLHGLIIDGSYVKTVTAASVSVANNQIVSEAGGDWATGRTAVKPAVEGDDMIDTPTNYTASGNNGGNYATLNAVNHIGNGVLSNGNLEVTGGTGTYHGFSTIGVSSGKWYAEIDCLSGGSASNIEIGIVDLEQLGTNDTQVFDAFSRGFGYRNDAKKITNNTASNYGATYDSGDVIGMAVDLDNGTLTFYKNGASQGTAFTGISSDYTYHLATFVRTSSDKVAFNFGQRPFAYTPPTGHVSLCTENLDDPTIADGSTALDVVTYTGNSVVSRSITGLNHSPDLLWIKSRSSTQWHFLADTVRGNTKNLASNASDAEETRTNRLLSFDSNGFSIGNNNTVNENSSNFVAWAWNAGANSSKTYTVKVVSDSGNKYRFDDFGTSAVTLDLEEGSTYVFDQSDSSNSGHPLRFSTTSDGTHNSGSEYTTGVTATGTPGSAGAKTTIVVAASAPTLYYYCTNHSGMGGQANTNSTAGASNFDGSIQSTVRANQTAGFSICTYTSPNNSSNQSVGHGLNVQPGLVIWKNRDRGYSWDVWHQSLSSTQTLQLDNTSGTRTVAIPARPGSSVFETKTSYTHNGTDNYLALCFAPVEGFSSFGTYTGNNSTDGPFIPLSFRPAWVMVKGTGSSNTFSWVIVDSTRSTINPTDHALFPNSNENENDLPNYGARSFTIDLLSNGFKIRIDPQSINTDGQEYIYAAFAEHPQKTARAR